MREEHGDSHSYGILKKVLNSDCNTVTSNRCMHAMFGANLPCTSQSAAAAVKVEVILLIIR